jgi:hypothetical protein
VLTPLPDPNWNTPHLYNDSNQFLQVVFASRNCEVFIDESGEMIGRYADVMGKLATRSRHYGHNVHFIAQRASQLDKTIRDQCTNLNLFCVSMDDAKTLANEYAKEELKGANLLGKGVFFKTGRFQSVEKMRVF